MMNCLTQAAHRALATQLADYVRVNHSRRISLKDLARHVHLNETYVSEIFKSQLGLGYAEYLCFVRIQRATTLLRASDEKVAVIGRIVGYPSDGSFRRAFRREMDMSPADYRKTSSADAFSPVLKPL